MDSSVESGEVRKAGVSPCAAPQGPVVDLELQVSKESEAVSARAEHTSTYMTRVSRGDRQAFGMLHRLCVQPVAAFFRRHPLYCETAEDLTQDVFIRVWEKRGKYRSGTPDLPYLLGFAQTILKESQAKKYQTKKTDADYLLDRILKGHQASPCHQAELREQRETLRTLIRRLPKKQRQALKLTYLHGLTSREASEILRCAAITIRINRQIGVEKLLTWLRAGE